LLRQASRYVILIDDGNEMHLAGNPLPARRWNQLSDRLAIAIDEATREHLAQTAARYEHFFFPPGGSASRRLLNEIHDPLPAAQSHGSTDLDARPWQKPLCVKSNLQYNF